MEEISVDCDSRELLTSRSGTDLSQVTDALSCVGKNWRWWCRSVTGQLILQWQESSELDVFEICGMGTGGYGIKLFFFKMLTLL